MTTTASDVLAKAYKDFTENHPDLTIVHVNRASDILFPKAHKEVFYNAAKHAFRRDVYYDFVQNRVTDSVSDHTITKLTDESTREDDEVDKLANGKHAQREIQNLAKSTVQSALYGELVNVGDATLVVDD